MITFKQFLEESRSAPLYHGTSLDALNDIMKTNLLKAGTHNPLSNSPAISLTRNLTFAKNWINEMFYYHAGAILQFDQQKLATRYKIFPFNFFGVPYTKGGPTGPARYYPYDKTHSRGKDYAFENQFEESIPTDIRDPMKYITRIYVYDDSHAPTELSKYPHIEVYSYKDNKRIK